MENAVLVMKNNTVIEAVNGEFETLTFLHHMNSYVIQEVGTLFSVSLSNMNMFEYYSLKNTYFAFP